MTNEQILEILGLDDIDQAAKDEVIENVRSTVELRVIGVITELMTDEQAEHFYKLQEEGDDQAIWDWLRHDIAGVDVSEVYEAILKDYLDNYKKNEFIV